MIGEPGTCAGTAIRSCTRALHPSVASGLGPATSNWSSIALSRGAWRKACLAWAYRKSAAVQALSRWLLETDGGSLLEPPLIGVVEAADPGQRLVVDYAGAYGEDGHRVPAHDLWCLVLGVQGDQSQHPPDCVHLQSAAMVSLAQVIPDDVQHRCHSAGAHPKYWAARCGALLWMPMLRLLTGCAGPAGALQRSLCGRRDEEQAAVSFVILASERLQLAAAPPAATPQQPLTLASLEATLFALTLAEQSLPRLTVTRCQLTRSLS